MSRFCLLLVFALTACQITTPLPPASPTPGLPQQTNTVVGNAASNSAVAVAPTWTPLPTLTPTSEPTATLTPQPTLTPEPTITPTIRPVAEPVVLIARPVANEFVPGSISVVGKVANVKSGIVLVELRSPDGPSLGSERVVASTTVVTDGLAFVGEIVFELPPTPRPFTVHVGWSEDGQAPVAEAGQPVNLLGRFPRIARLTLLAPEPFIRSAEPTIAVRGMAPGPPNKVLARLLDDNDQVIESVEAQLRWYQPGLPCDFDAVLSNNPSATQVQVIMLGPDDAVLEAARVRLAPRS